MQTTQANYSTVKKVVEVETEANQVQVTLSLDEAAFIQLVMGGFVGKTHGKLVDNIFNELVEAIGKPTKISEILRGCVVLSDLFHRLPEGKSLYEAAGFKEDLLK